MPRAARASAKALCLETLERLEEPEIQEDREPDDPDRRGRDWGNLGERCGEFVVASWRRGQSLLPPHRCGNAEHRTHPVVGDRGEGRHEDEPRDQDPPETEDHHPVRGAGELQEGREPFPVPLLREPESYAAAET